MNTRPFTPEMLTRSVIAVPPLARNAAYDIDRDQNQSMIRYLEAGGVSTLLYGGNAILNHVSPSEYANLLALIADAVNDSTWAIPSAGPNFGWMMEQSVVLRDFDFPTAMILPTRDAITAEGAARGVRRFVESFGRPVVLYIKHDGIYSVEDVRRLVDDQLVSWIKYAIVRDDPADDPFLEALVDAVDPRRIVSGMGEQPAVIHCQKFGLNGFTSGCVCIAPRLSMQMLRALQANNYDEAEQIRRTFAPLEHLRDSIHPVRVLHAAVTLAEIAQMGPVLPLLSEIADRDQDGIRTAARQLKDADENHKY